MFYFGLSYQFKFKLKDCHAASDAQYLVDYLLASTKAANRASDWGL